MLIPWGWTEPVLLKISILGCIATHVVAWSVCLCVCLYVCVHNVLDRDVGPLRGRGNFGVWKGLAIVKYRDYGVWAVQRTLSQLSWHLARGLVGALGTVLDGGPDPPTERGTFGGFVAPWTALGILTSFSVIFSRQRATRGTWRVTTVWTLDNSCNYWWDCFGLLVEIYVVPSEFYTVNRKKRTFDIWRFFRFTVYSVCKFCEFCRICCMNIWILRLQKLQLRQQMIFLKCKQYCIPPSSTQYCTLPMLPYFPVA